MKPAPFTYHDPASLDDLVSVLAAHEDAKILAGGQSLMPMLNMRYVIPDHVVDINKIPELSYIDAGNGSVKIGAMTRQRQLMASGAIAKHCPVMHDALTHVGHFQTRNRGTIGGSLCHLDPSAELPAVACLLDAQLTVRGPKGERTVDFDDWPLAYMTPNLEPEEVLTSIGVPVWTNPHGFAFVEFARRHGDFAIAAAGALLELDAKKTITRAALCIAGANTRPIRLAGLEKSLIGERANARVFAQAAAEASKIEAVSDAYVTAAYRQRLAGVLTERALNQAAVRAAGKA